MSCAFLRGVNVNGRTIKMADVRAVLEAAAMQYVTSLLASGNILFSSAEAHNTLRPLLESALFAHYNQPVSLFVKTREQLSAMLHDQPFLPDPTLHVYVFICEDGFENTLLSSFQKITPFEKEAVAVNDGLFYWQVPKGATLDAGFSNTLEQKRFKDRFTSRNMNTIQKIVQKMPLWKGKCNVLLTAIIFITLALVFYSVGVWAEKIKGTLLLWHVIVFWLGFVCDTTGTLFMGQLAQGSAQTGLSFHAITGAVAIFLMLLHAVWATIVIARKNQQAAARFHRFSLVVWGIWLIPYLSGLILGMRG